MSRPLECLTRLVVRFPRLVLLLGGLAAVASVWLTMTQLGFRTSRANLLNPKSDYNRRWLEYTKEFGDKEDVVVVVEGESREQIIPALGRHVPRAGASARICSARCCTKPTRRNFAPRVSTIWT